jgi:outer membrane protein, heavy metal efflux system
MATTFRFVIFIVLLAIGSPVAAGQPPSAGADQDQNAHLAPPTYGGAQLTLSAALNEALARNPTLVAARLEFESVRQRRAQEGFLAAPTLEAQIWQWPLDSLNPLNTNMYMFTVSQEIPGSGKRALRAAVVDKDVERSSNEIAVRAREVLNQVKRAYADLFVSRQAIAVHQAGVDLLRQIADLTTARYGAGRGAQQDALKTVLEMSRLHNDLVMLDEQVQLATVTLNTLLNRPADAPIGELLATTDDRPVPPVSELQRVALEQHPELRGAQIDVERAEAALAVANRDYKPDFMVGGGYQLMPRSVGAWTATVGMTWPGAPWARGRLDAAKAQAVADIAAAKARQEVAVTAIASAVQQAYVRVTSARTRVLLLRTSVVPQSQQMVEAARIAYENNRGDAEALLDHQHATLDAQLQYFRALSDLEQARADLERAVGADLPAAATTVAQEGR